MKHLPEATTLHIRPVPPPWALDYHLPAAGLDALDPAEAELSDLLREQDEEHEGEDGEPRCHGEAWGL